MADLSSSLPKESVRTTREKFEGYSISKTAPLNRIAPNLKSNSNGSPVSAQVNTINNSGYPIQTNDQSDKESRQLSVRQEELLKKVRDPTTGVEVKEQIFIGMKFPNAFKGAKMVKWFMLTEDMTRKDAFATGAAFLKHKKISHCSSDILPFTAACFYRFTD